MTEQTNCKHCERPIERCWPNDAGSCWRHVDHRQHACPTLDGGTYAEPSSTRQAN